MDEWLSGINFSPSSQSGYSAKEEEASALNNSNGGTGGGANNKMELLLKTFKDSRNIFFIMSVFVSGELNWRITMADLIYLKINTSIHWPFLKGLEIPK